MIDIGSSTDDQFEGDLDEFDEESGFEEDFDDQAESEEDGEFITDGDPLSLDEVFAAMGEGHPEAAEALLERWGEDAEENVRHAQSAAKELLTPGLQASLEHAGVIDNPEFIELAARLGRQMSDGEGRVSLDALSDGERDHLEDQHTELTTRINDALDRGDSAGAQVLDDARRRVAQRITGEAVSRSPVERVPSRRASLEDRHTKLTRALHDALDRGNHKEVQRLDAERNSVARKLVGNGPIVGQLATDI